VVLVIWSFGINKTITMSSCTNSVVIPVKKKNGESENKEKEEEKGSTAAVPLNRLG